MHPLRRTARSRCQPSRVRGSARFSDRPPPPRVIIKHCREMLVVNQERKADDSPNQLRPTVLPRGFQVEPASVVSPSPGAGRSSGSRALRLTPDSYSPPLPGRKGQCDCGVVLAYRCGAAPDSHRVPFCSLMKSANQHGPESIVGQDRCQARAPGRSVNIRTRRGRAPAPSRRPIAPAWPSSASRSFHRLSSRSLRFPRSRR